MSGTRARAQPSQCEGAIVGNRKVPGVGTTWQVSGVRTLYRADMLSAVPGVPGSVVTDITLRMNIDENLGPASADREDAIIVLMARLIRTLRIRSTTDPCKQAAGRRVALFCHVQCNLYRTRQFQWVLRGAHTADNGMVWWLSTVTQGAVHRTDSGISPAAQPFRLPTLVRQEAPDRGIEALTQPGGGQMGPNPIGTADLAVG